MFPDLEDWPAEIIVYYLLPNFDPSTFIKFALLGKQTWHIVNSYLSAKRGAETWDSFRGTNHVNNIISKSIPRKHGKCSVIKISNKQIKKYTYYVNGQRHGEHVKYYPNGNIKITCFYRNNKLHGVYKKFTPGGFLESHILYENGNSQLLPSKVKIRKSWKTWESWFGDGLPKSMKHHANSICLLQLTK